MSSNRFAAAVVVALAFTPVATVAQGITIIPPLVITPDVVTPAPPHVTPAAPQVTAVQTHVQATIRDGVATTEVRQVLKNTGGGNAEATWMLPLPPDAVADGFTMKVAGKEVASEVIDATKARAIYEQIVRQQRDPGLLEYMGHGLLRARVFPIPANGTIEVEVRYRQVLAETAGLHRWDFPVRMTGVQGAATEKVSVDLQIESRKPIKTVYSPLGGVDVVRKDDHHARASLELSAGQFPERDLTVFYGVSADAFGLDLLPWRQAGKPGHFLLMATPQHEWQEPANTVRVVQFVLDTSGSMQGEKIAQARRALEFFVASLKPTDRFNVVPFSTEARPFFEAPVLANDENRAIARDKIAALEARGGTNIDEALSWALSHAKAEGNDPDATAVQLVPITVFLTDGLPTVGRTDPGELLAAFTAANVAKARVFVFGVGNDVNTRLLDSIAEQTRGDRDYVREGEDLEVRTGALFTKLSNPVLTDLELRFEGIEVVDLQPRELPDLFQGSRLLVVGRYTGEGHRAVRLRGKVGGEVHEYVYEATFPAESAEHEFVATLWAQRKVATLLDAIRLNGANPELVEEVKRLGQEYGVVTPYTSHLIVEEGMQLAQARGQVGFHFEAGNDGFGFWRDDLVRRGSFTRDFDVESLYSLGERAEVEAENSRTALRTLSTAPADGRGAVDASVNLVLARRAAAPESRAFAGLPALGEEAKSGQAGSSTSLLTHRAGGRTLIFTGETWVDREFRAEMHGKERKITTFSDEYFALLVEHPDLAKVFAFSSRLVLVVDGAAIEIAPAE